ncbi:hypothetical protein WDZ92_37515, partial [Nostoc sp. NIES-2111]
SAPASLRDLAAMGAAWAGSAVREVPRPAKAIRVNPKGDRLASVPPTGSPGTPLLVVPSGPQRAF